MIIGKVLHNRYKITEYIGCGGMADVYKALDMLLEREVAIKILRPQFSRDENFIAKFHREAQSAAGLSHNNIVSIFDVGQEDGIYFIVMEYIAGETLQKLIDREAPLSSEKAIFIARGVLQALSKAHQCGIIHCDIKPHNILLTEAGMPKVSDFGIACAISSASTPVEEEGILGSVHYLSPEQAQGGKLICGSDLYSLGIVLFEMLTGKVPFSGDTPREIALQHVQAPPPVLREFNESVPPVLESVLLKALAKQPQDRYESAQKFIKDLDTAETFLHDESYSPNDATVMLQKLIVDEDEQYSSDPIRKFKQNKFFAMLAVLILLVGGFFIGTEVIFSQIWNVGEVKVPNVIGKQTAEAKEILERNLLEVVEIDEHNANVPAGFVISQDPAVGSVVKEQRQVTIFVSKGQESVETPNLVGTNIKDARVVLTNVSLLLGKIEEQDVKDKPEGTILTQVPAPGAKTEKGSYIDLVIVASKDKKVGVPDLTGLNLDAAKRQLSTSKLQIGKVETKYTDKEKAGTIIEQTPASGSRISEGGSVSVVIAKATKDKPKPPEVKPNTGDDNGGKKPDQPPVEQNKNGTVSFTVPDGNKKQNVKIVATDSKNKRVVYEGKHKPGDNVSKSVNGIGSIKVEFYCDDKLVGEQTI